jgi:hypothetical protein
MSTQPFEPKPTPVPAKGLVQIGADPQAALEAIIQQRLAEEKARLEKEAGIKKTDYHHFKKPVENMFTKQQRGHTTLLFGGLTWKHEKLLHAAFECERLPNRQGIWQQRAMQPDLLHRWQRGAVSAAAGRAGADQARDY